MITTLKPIEYDIMKFVWENEMEGVTFGEIHLHVNGLGKELTRQRVNLYIQTLIAEDMLKAEGKERRKLYYPSTSKDKYDNSIAHEFLMKLFDNSLKKFVIALMGGQSLPDKTAKELKAILKKAKNSTT